MFLIYNLFPDACLIYLNLNLRKIVTCSLEKKISESTTVPIIHLILKRQIHVCT